MDARINLLIAQANANNSDLVVKGILAGEERGWRMSSPDTFASDKAGEGLLSDMQLRALAQTVGQELTYIAVRITSTTVSMRRMVW